MPEYGSGLLQGVNMFCSGGVWLGLRTYVSQHMISIRSFLQRVKRLSRSIFLNQARAGMCVCLPSVTMHLQSGCISIVTKMDTKITIVMVLSWLYCYTSFNV